MARDVRIGVSADTSRLKQDVRDVTNTTKGVTQGFNEANAAAAAIDKSVERLEGSLERAKALAALLGRELGRSFDPRQAQKMADEFDRLQQRQRSGSKVNTHGNLEDFLQNYQRGFNDPRAADRYRRNVLSFVGNQAGLGSDLGGHQRTPGKISPHSPQQSPSQPPQQPQHRPAPVLPQPSGQAPGAGTPVQPSGTRGALPVAAGSAGGHTAGHSGDDRFGAMTNRAGMQVAGIAKGVLGLAGLTGAMAMAGKAADLARDESQANDQLLRSMGDLNREFDTLQVQVRNAGNGLGVSYAESSVLARQYATAAGAGAGTDVAGNLRTAYGISRAYGLDTQEGVSFMANARHYGAIDEDDTDGRRFSLMIAEAIERGQATSKATDFLAAIAGYTGSIARFTLNAPNAGAYAGALSSLTASKTVGLDPSNAASIINAADMSIRGGGGAGEAGQNFSYAMLMRANPGIDPITARLVMEQGAFGSGNDLSTGILGRYFARNGMDSPILSSQNNFSMMRGGIREQYENPVMRLDAMKNYFGLSSLSHAAALDEMNPNALDGMQGLLSRAGVSMKGLSASGIQNLGQIAGADDAQLQQIYDRVSTRNDLNDAERSRLEGAFAGGGSESLREALASIVATREQESNVGTETRDAAVRINDTLTRIGTNILPVLSTIQNAVVAMAVKVSPDSALGVQAQPYISAQNYQVGRQQLQRDINTQLNGIDSQASKDRNLKGRSPKAVEQWQRTRVRQQHERLEEYDAAHADDIAYLRQNGATVPSLGISADDAEGIFGTGQSGANHGPVDLGMGGATTSPAAHGGGGGRIGKVRLTGDERATLMKVAGNDPKKLRFLQTTLAIENRGFGKVNNSAVSPAGAGGAFQLMPGTAAAYGVTDRTDFGQSTAGAARMYDDLNRQYGGNFDAMLAHYNGGTAAGRAVANGGMAPAKETRDYLEMAHSLNNGGLMPTLPSGGSVSGGGAGEQTMTINVTGTLYDRGGREVGTLSAPDTKARVPAVAGTR